MGNIFDLLLLHPITNLLIGIYQFLVFLHTPYPLGIAIILLTVLVRLILWPVVAAQIKSAYKMQKVAPHIANVREKHKDDKKKQQEEMMRLYKEHNVNPAAGCLPLLIQIPLTIALYNVLTHSVTITDKIKVADIVHKINEALYFPFLKIDVAHWYTDFLSFSLADSPQKIFAHNPIVLVVPIATGIFQFILSRMMVPENTNTQTVKKALPAGRQDDFQSAFQTQSLFIFPIMIAFFSFTLPLGMSLYWNTFTIFGILQQYILIGPGGAKNIFDKLHIPSRS